MVNPITATYVHDDADWTITVSGPSKELTDRAPGIIAARDRADQLAEKVAPEHGGKTVVHLLNGSALDFTAAYIEARLTTSGPQLATAQSGAAQVSDPAGAESAGSVSPDADTTANTETTSASAATEAGSADNETTPAFAQKPAFDQKEAAVAAAAGKS